MVVKPVLNERSAGAPCSGRSTPQKHETPSKSLKHGVRSKKNSVGCSGQPVTIDSNRMGGENQLARGL